MLRALLLIGKTLPCRPRNPNLRRESHRLGYRLLYAAEQHSQHTAGDSIVTLRALLIGRWGSVFLCCVTGFNRSVMGPC